MSAVFETFKSQSGIPVIPEPGMLFKITSMITLAGGTMFLLWLGERNTELVWKNGVSLIIFTGIAVELPSEVIQKFTLYRNGELSGFHILLFFGVILVAFYVVTFVERSFRNIPVQTLKKWFTIVFTVAPSRFPCAWILAELCLPFWPLPS